jgi:bifunctional DNA-binding transcriptional regulator/antitoxin component of YhaV-PrlF toxin-antitoxin module
MAKVTSKLQVTVPKAIAQRYGIEPGSDIEWAPAGDFIRVLPPGARSEPDAAARLRLFDAATVRQKRRSRRAVKTRPPKDRGWRREDLYRRGRTG